jgi:hypothetical protein
MKCLGGARVPACGFCSDVVEFVEDEASGVGHVVAHVDRPVVSLMNDTLEAVMEMLWSCRRAVRATGVIVKQLCASTLPTAADSQVLDSGPSALAGP